MALKVPEDILTASLNWLSLTIKCFCNKWNRSFFDTVTRWISKSFLAESKIFRDSHLINGQNLLLFVILLSSFLVHDLKEGIYDVRVEIAARVFFYYSHCAVSVKCFSVGPVGCHGFIAVGHCKDARAQIYGVSFESIRISFSVESLVMLKDNGNNFFIGGNGLQNSRPQLRVLLHCFCLFGCKFSRLIQNINGNTEFSDVMEKASSIQVVNILMRELHGFSDLHGQFSAPFGVSSRPWRFRVDSTGKSRECSQVQLVQFLEPGPGLLEKVWAAWRSRKK